MMDYQIVFFPIFIVWCLFLLVLLLRKGVEWVWKLCAVFISVFYTAWFYEQTLVSYALLTGDFINKAPILCRALADLFSLTLFILWPMTLVAVTIRRENRTLMRPLVLLTLIFWLFWFMDQFTPPFLSNLLSWCGVQVESLMQMIGSPPVE